MLLHEAGRVADHMFVEVPLEDNYRQKKNYVSNEDKEGHINPYSPTTIRWLLQTSGFDVLKQIVTIPCYAVFRYSLGKTALVVYPPLKAAVQFFPTVATQFFTYHCALLCKKVISCDCEPEHC